MCGPFRLKKQLIFIAIVLFLKINVETISVSFFRNLKCRILLVLSKISSITGYLVALAGLVYLIYNGFIFSENIVIIIVQILSFGLMIWARMILKFRSFHLTSDITEGRLVTKGPYKWFRHPIYAAVIYFSSSCLFAFPRIEVFIAFIFIASGLFLRMILEEKELKQKYPEYIEYSKKAKRIIPYVY